MTETVWHVASTVAKSTGPDDSLIAHAQVYVMGGSVVLVRRPTLSLHPDASRSTGLEAVDRVSAFPATHSTHAEASTAGGGNSEDAEPPDALNGHRGHEAVPSPAAALPDPPPEWVIVALAQRLQQRMRLQLFNFDVLRPLHSKDTLYVCDCNYFPGFEKLPGSMERMVTFLTAVVHGEKHDGRYGPDSYATCVQLTPHSLAA